MQAALFSVSVAPASQAATHHYRIDFAADSTEIRVEGRLAQAGMSLSAGRIDPASLQQVTDCTGQSLRKTRRIHLSDSQSCFRYLVRPQPETGNRWPVTFEDVRMFKMAKWLMLPVLQPADEVVVTMATAAGLQISVPWPLVDSTHRIRPSPRSSEGFVVVGKFADVDLRESGVEKAAVYLGPPEHQSKIGAWLGTQVAGVRDAFGAFPNPQVQIIAVAVASNPARSPVPFGHVIRDQGETIQFFVDPTRSLNELLDDWTAAHELAHLALPYVQDKWVSEGFASYYQNVLQARGGYYSEQEAWANLTRSFARAAAESGHMSPGESGQHDFWQARMMIYWSGAALALHADVELRKASANQESLDSVLSRYAACCLPGVRSWRARELFQALDGVTEYPVFVKLYNRYADAKGMPPTKELFHALGVAGAGARARLTGDTPLAPLRKAIMTKRLDR